MRRGTLIGFGAVAAVILTIVGVSVVWPGLDAQDTPPTDASVWVLQADGLRYGRVNTAVGELDTVRTVANPSRIAESAEGAYMFTDSDSKMIRIDESLPADLDVQGLEDATAAPSGVRETVTAGDFVAYRTDAGAVYVGRLSTGSTSQLDPYDTRDDEDAVQYSSAAIAVDERGVLFSYSNADDVVLTYDIASSSLRDEDEFAADIDDPQLSAAGDDWVIVDAAAGTFWTAGGSAAPVGAGSTLTLARPDADADAVHAADETGLVELPVDGSPARSLFGDGSTVQGTPARPVTRDGVVYGAWLAEGSGGGTLWRSDAGPAELSYGGLGLPSQRRPVFASSGDALVVNDSRSGWVWLVEGARLLPSTQDWTLDERIESESTPSDEEQSVVIEPKPPVAVDDAFGVRPGALVGLPLLLNDHDPNEDVLSIDAASVTGLDPAFGTLTTTDDQQRLAVRVSPDASGTASFSYRVTDGTSHDGLLSEEATVTLTVAADADNSAPVWCVDDCRQEWPVPTVARGGTVTVPVLSDWVDPEGDPLFLLSADGAGSGSVAATPSGSVVYQHADDGSGGEETIRIRVTVSDARGATATRPLEIRVVADPEPRIRSFAIVDTVGSRVTVDVAPHVTGTAGDTTVTDARVLDDAVATATVVGGTTQFDFSATEPGVYRVAVTVSVAGRETTGTARITLLPEDAPAQLATAPVVAFVRPQADATVDVFAAVSNPTRRVLLLSDVTATPAPGASLSVDAVAQTQLRVSGTTADGETGLLGTVSYRVSDGTNDDGSSVEGQATVYLLPPAPEVAPIAVDDTVVVRAGSQVDIPILRNDISPAGALPRIAPESIVSSTASALAFASGDVLRYLAPQTAGQYTVEYAVFTPGSPSLIDTATVRIRVQSDDANRAPLPAALSGRVLSGLTTTIPFDGFGVDPDGDAVRLDAIVTQPDVGSASISADGTSIVYASVPGDRGQHEFRFRVVDAHGAEGEGVARVGVLSGDANPSPVTYTDYVHVQAGVDNVIRVSPLANDLDPMQGALTLDGVIPDVPATDLDGSPSDEFERLSDRISVIEDGTVTIAAGTEPGTMSFLYDVTSSSQNTARGLIVVKVVRERVPEYPVVTDTVLTVEDRDDFATGVDVLTGKVTWAGGELPDLELGVWGDPDGVAASGRRLSGELTDSTRIIPFSVTGVVGDEELTTYAFLRVPAAAELSLALRRGLAPIAVDEGDLVTFDMADLVAVPDDEVLEVGGAVEASGARAAGACEATSGTKVRYTAGSGAPWTDACLVPVRLAGQRAWTVLSVPIAVDAEEPQPVLTPAALTVAPGQSRTYDLADMTSWQGPEDWDALRYRIDDQTSAFDVELDGAALALTVADDAVPGAVETVVVEITSHDGVAPARITLRVGAAPSTLPRGGSITRQCSQADGGSCTIDVVGIAGEVNPLPGTPLTAVGVRASGSCTGVTFELASSTQVRARWTEDAPGSTCTAAVTLRDAQGRQTAADRGASVTLDLQGFPAAPASVTQTAYGDGTLLLRVDPGAARQAYPAVTGYEVRLDGRRVASCTAQGVCPEIAAPNGVQRVYEAVAVNPVGASRGAVRTTAWAYDPPRPPSAISSRPVVTSGDGGIVALSITGVDAAATGALEIASASGETLVVAVGENQTQVAVPSYRVGSNTATDVTVTPRSRFAVPPVGSDAPVIESITAPANGIGRPLDVTLTLTAEYAGNGRSDVTAVASARSGGDGSQLRFGIVRDGETCTADSENRTAVFRDLPDGRQYAFVVCVESRFDGAGYGRSTARAEVRAVQSSEAPTGYRFVVGPTAHVEGQRANWTIDQTPTSPENPPFDNVAVFSGYPTGTFDEDPGIRVRYEHTAGWWVSEWGAVTPAAGSAPFQVQAQWSVDSCTGGTRLVPRGSSTRGIANVTFNADELVYYDADGAVLDPGPDPWIVPLLAVRASGIGVTADWSARDWSLQPATSTFSTTCTPVLPVPEPEPEPEP